MTIEKAEQARKILDRIDELNDYFNTFYDAASIDITIASIDRATHILCQKGETNEEIVRFILAGIYQQIQSLKEELECL